jgi:hypothetical protein
MELTQSAFYFHVPQRPDPPSLVKTRLYIEVNTIFDQLRKPCVDFLLKESRGPTPTFTGSLWGVPISPVYAGDSERNYEFAADDFSESEGPLSFHACSVALNTLVGLLHCIPGSEARLAKTHLNTRFGRFFTELINTFEREVADVNPMFRLLCEFEEPYMTWALLHV